ncbi:hypothetical protein D3C72_1660390 [compost metagenome]
MLRQAPVAGLPAANPRAESPLVRAAQMQVAAASRRRAAVAAARPRVRVRVATRPKVRVRAATRGRVLAASRVRPVAARRAAILRLAAMIGSPVALRRMNPVLVSWAVDEAVRAVDRPAAARGSCRRVRCVPYKRKPVTNQAFFQFIW